MNSTFVRACPLALTTLAAVLPLTERPAQACGGCFHRPTETTVVTDHRMAFSVSTRQSVLWDQIKYSGEPSDFSWVLPVQRGTVIQASHDEWFAALDATTAPVITGPQPHNCNGNSFSCGSSQSSAAFASGGEGAGGGVQVLSQGVVGPYDTATLHATDPNALENWLNANGYVLPDSMRPTVSAYVAGGFDFIALRLQPGQGIQAMQPVRVVTQGADELLPLRMVAAGVGAQVGITLYVISEGRYEARSPFFNATLDGSKLTWSATNNVSNYQEVSLGLMQGHNGHTWLTEFSGTLSFEQSQFNVGCGNRGSFFYGNGQSLADVYMSQCPCPVDAGSCGSPGGPVGSVDAADEASPDAAGDATPDAADDTGQSDAQDLGDVAAESDSAVAADAPAPDSGAPPGAGAVPQCPTIQSCADFDDLDVALVGLNPQSVWVTRMRAVLAANALSEGDLHLQAAASQTPVSNRYTVNVYDDPNYSPCGTTGGCSATDTSSPVGNWLVLGTFGFLGVALVRRRMS